MYISPAIVSTIWVVSCIHLLTSAFGMHVQGILGFLVCYTHSTVYNPAKKKTTPLNQPVSFLVIMQCTTNAKGSWMYCRFSRREVVMHPPKAVSTGIATSCVLEECEEICCTVCIPSILRLLLPPVTPTILSLWHSVIYFQKREFCFVLTFNKVALFCI